MKPGETRNPAGRPKGVKNKRTLAIQEMLARYQFDPYEAKVKLARSLGNKIQRNGFDTSGERIEYLKIYADVLRDLIQYAHPRLRVVENYTQLEIVAKLQALHAVPDAELAALLDEANALISRAEVRR